MTSRKRARELGGERGSYELDDQPAGSGVYARVFGARCLASGRRVAVKMLRESVKVSILDGERRSLRRLAGHANVVALLDHGPRWYAMDYAPTTLDRLIRRMKGLPFQRAGSIKGYWVQLLRALVHCHKHGVVHRDLKPANVLVDAECVLKLADFGMAGTLREGKRVLSGHNEYVTLWYRAPELLMRFPTYGAAVDVWAAGCVLAEMLFGGKALFVCFEDSARKQMNVVWALRGTPSAAEWPQAVRSTVARSLRGFGRQVPLTHMRQQLTADNKSTHAALFVPEALATLERALHPVPDQRASAAQLLEDAYVTRAHPKPFTPVQLAASK